MIRNFGGLGGRRWWLTTWRVGGAVLLVALVAGFARQVVAEPVPVRQDPVSQLECDGPDVVLTEVLYGADGPAGTVHPAQVAQSWVASQSAARVSEGATSHETVFTSEDVADIAFADASGVTTAIVSLVKDPQLGWIVEASYECA